MTDVTRILSDLNEGDARAADRLLTAVYDELRKLAAHRMRKEPPGQTLQPTALVHEAWLRLVGDENPRFENRAHFFAAAAEAMRRILVENARKKARVKRGGDRKRIDLADADPAAPLDDENLLALDEALEQLAGEGPEQAEIVKLRYFAGLTIEEAALVLGVSRGTADRRFAFARAWLYDEIRKG